MSITPEQQELLDICESEGYMNARIEANGEVSAIRPLMYTYAIITGITNAGYENRWCYKNYPQALIAYLDWNGEGEPTGWHRHPSTGRRVDEEGNMTVNW